MNLRNTTLLFGLLLGMLWVFGLTVAYKKITVDPSYIVPTLQSHPDAVIDYIKIVRDGKDTFVFQKLKDNWTLNTDKQNLRVENSKIDEIIRQIKDAKKNDEANVTNDLPQYELDHPRVVATLRGKAGPKDDREMEWTFNIGKDSPDRKFVYVNSSDAAKRVYAMIPSTIDSLMFKDPNHLRARTLFESSETSIKELALKGDSQDIDLTKNTEGNWRFARPAYGPVDSGAAPPPPETNPFDKSPPPPPPVQGGIKSLLNAISAIKVGSEDDFVPPSDASLASFGLEAGKEALRVSIVGSAAFASDKEAKTETLLVGNKVPGKDQVYARMDGDPGVVKLPIMQIEPFKRILADPASLRSKDISDIELSKNIDVVSIKGGSAGDIKFLKPEGKSWEVQAGTETPKPANEKTVQNLLEALQGKKAIKSFVDTADAKADAELGLDHPQAEVELYIDGLNKKESKTDSPFDKKDEKKEEKKDDKPFDPYQIKKDAKPALSLAFGKTEGDVVYVKRTLPDGTVNRFTVDKVLVERLRAPEGSLVYLSTSMPPLGDVSRLTIFRDKNKLEVERGQGENAKKWYFASAGDPKARELADTGKIQSIISTLSTMQAQKWLRKVDPKDDLSTQGLAEPTTKVTLFVKKDRVEPKTAASILGNLGVSGPSGYLSAAAALLAGVASDKGEEVTLSFGKESDVEKDKPNVFARDTANDLLFLASPDVPKMLRDIDLRDRSYALRTEPILTASLVGLEVMGGPVQLLRVSPFGTNQIVDLDPAQVRNVKIALRTPAELRQFQFSRPDAEKEWTDQMKLPEFNIDSAKVQTFVEKVSRLTPERWVSFGGPRADQKLTPKDATVTIDLGLANGKTVTIVIGAAYEFEASNGYFVQASNWPEAVGLLSTATVRPWLGGLVNFAKERVAQAP